MFACCKRQQPKNVRDHILPAGRRLLSNSGVPRDPEASEANELLKATGWICCMQPNTVTILGPCVAMTCQIRLPITTATLSIGPGFSIFLSTMSSCATPETLLCSPVEKLVAQLHARLNGTPAHALLLGRVNYSVTCGS